LDGQVDRIRMVTVSTDNLNHFSDCSKWSYVICSRYALRKIGEYVTIEYYKDLCTTANAINDNGLFGIAFENYIHTMARNNLPISLNMQKYDSDKLDIHEYKSLIIDRRDTKYTEYLLEGKSEDECKQIIAKELGSAGYWRPCIRFLKTIDCVAKLEYGNKTVFGLLQITKSKCHNIDAKYLDTISEKLTPKVYIAVVPNKYVCDKFRLNPVDPKTEIPLYVAYLEDIFFEKFGNVKDDRN